MAILAPEQIQALGLKAPVNPAMAATSAKLITQPLQQSDINANTINEGQARLPGVQAQSTVESATVQPQIQQKTADAVAAQQKADQAHLVGDTQKFFDSVKGKDGYVSPQNYNVEKQKAAGIGIDGDTFDKTFAQSYTNPNNIYYDTPEQKVQRAPAQEVYNLIKEYNRLVNNGKAGGALGENGVTAKIPVANQYLNPDGVSYENYRRNVAGQIRQLISAGQGSGFRFNFNELQQIANLLPSIDSSTAVANSNMDKLDQLMKNSFGVGIEDFKKADPEYQQRGKQ